MPDVLIAGIGGVLLGIAMTSVFTVLALSRADRRADQLEIRIQRLQRNVGVVTEDVH